MGGLVSFFFYDEEEHGTEQQRAADELRTGRPGERRPTGPGLVQMDQVTAKKGCIAVSSRYTHSYETELEQDYEIQDKVLGTGMSGPVRLALGRSDGRKYAVKSFKKSGLSARSRQELRNEAELYLQLDHPHIAQLSMVFETDEALHLIMEFMEGGELYTRLASKKRYTEEAAADATYQMLLAVAYLHAHKIAHRDLKLENFLYESKTTNHLKLIDFGFAKHWDPNTRMSQACGSIHYVAPEVLFQSYTVQADMWSMGIVAYMLLTGSPAFHGPEKEILRRIKACKPHFSSRFSRLSESAQDFVKSLLIRNPTERLSAARALEHPWIKGRHLAASAAIDTSILGCLRGYAEASRFRRAALSMMAWSLSAEDQRELREQFLLLDVQKRGSITLKQLKLMLKENFDVSGDEAERVFSMIDSDNSQEIEYSEFLAAALVGRVSAHGDVLRRTFARFDRDESGLIDADELRTVLGDHFEGTHIEELIKEVDTSGDGLIDYDEFIAYFQQHDVPSSAEASPTTPASSEAPSFRPCSARTQKLASMIDRLLTLPEVASKEEVPSSHLLQPKIVRRAMTLPTSLPTLLGQSGAVSEKREKP